MSTILKRETVDIHSIFEKRFSEIARMENTKDSANDKNSYEEARKVVMCVENQMNVIGSDLIYNLVNYNLCDAMVLYCNVLINARWVACKEHEYKGSFVLDGNHYRITTESILRAISNGNSEGYVDGQNSNIPNILYNELEGSDLIGLYIVRYMIRKNATAVFGENYVLGKDILSDLMSVFANSSDSEVRIDSWRHRIRKMIEYLYKSRILFRSLYDIEVADESQTERIYNDDYKLYLAPRGKCLYGLLSGSAVLQEIYRDDIYTDLQNNDRLSSQLSQDARFEYLLNYLEVLFQIEKRNIANAIPNLKKYQELLGEDFITVPLLEGVVKNLDSYYREDKTAYTDLMNSALYLRDEMKCYAQDMEKKYGVRFVVSDFLEKKAYVEL
jgi:hypothetical protein